jgi:branched-chain amino acid transport system substrate-binding protein
VKTGPLAQGGIQMEQGIASFLKENGNTLAHCKIEFVSADTGGDPAGAKIKAQELVECDKVSVILGPLAAFELLAITDYVREKETPLISLAAAEDVTQRKANPYVIGPSATSAQCCHAIADYAVKELKYNRAATISEDFAFGYEQMAGFQHVFEDGGGKIVKKLWPPLNTPDYTPYIAQISNLDCVFNGFAGSNPVKFMRAYADLGLAGKTRCSPAGPRWMTPCYAASATRRSAWYRRIGIRRILTHRATTSRGCVGPGLQGRPRRLRGRHVHRRPMRRGSDCEA